VPHILPCLPPTASTKSQAVYEEFYRGMGFPRAPNFILTQGHSENVARGSWEAVRNILVGGEIARWLKELMFVAISVERQCMYCAAAHVACCRMLDVNPDWVAAAEQNNLDLIGDLKLRAMVSFAVKCARNPQSLAPSDFSKMRSFGLKESEIVEIIGMAAFAVYANIIADATAMQADDMFEEL
jgi:uncharacterized peroxidase-related enzyme